MITLNDEIDAQWETLTDHDNHGMETFSGIKHNVAEYFAATKIVMDAALQVVSSYASSLGKPDYYNIDTDEWRIGQDWNTSDATGICFTARVNVGQWRDPEYRERLLTVPWEIIQEYFDNPQETKTRLHKLYSQNVAKVKAEEERKAKEALAAANERTRIASEERDRKEFIRLTEKYAQTTKTLEEQVQELRSSDSYEYDDGA